MRNKRDLAEAARAFDDAAAFKLHLNSFNHRALVRERFGRRDCAVGVVLVRRGEDLFGGHVGNAVGAVAGGRSAAEPQMAVGESEAEVCAGTAVTQRSVALLVQKGSAFVQLGVVGLPRVDRIGHTDARGLEDGVPEFVERDVWSVIGKHLCGPCRRGAGDDGPVDLVTRDEFERGTVGGREGAVGAADLVWIFIGEQRWIGPSNSKARRAAFEGGADAVVEPFGGVVEAGVGREAITQQRSIFVGVERGDEGRAGAVGVLGDAARERNGVERGRHEKLLPSLEAEADLHGDFSELVELLCKVLGLFGRGDRRGGHRAGYSLVWPVREFSTLKAPSALAVTLKYAPSLPPFKLAIRGSAL